MGHGSFDEILQEKLEPQGLPRAAGRTSATSVDFVQNFGSSQSCAEYFTMLNSNLSKSVRAFRTYLDNAKVTFEKFQADYARELAAQQATSQENAPVLLWNHLSPEALVSVELMKRGGEELSFPLSEKHLKAKYRALAKKSHPDIVGASSSSAEAFRAYTDAYHTLLEELSKAA